MQAAAAVFCGINMTNIRKKIEKIPMDPTYITTIPRVGYRMLESQTASVV